MYSTTSQASLLVATRRKDNNMGIKETLLEQGQKLLTDPRVTKIMSDERVMKAVMNAVSVPGKVQTFTEEQVAKLAKAMALATEDEVKDLRRTVRRLEEEMEAIRAKDKKK